MAEKKKNAKTIGKPNPFLYYLLAYVAGTLFRLICRVRIDRSALQNLQGPAFIVCPHISNMDFILAALALLPHRPNFVTSEHFMARPLIRWILTKMAVIPKKMYCADIRAMRSILQAKDQGHLIVIYPEGRLSCFGHSVNLTDGTAELVKKLGINVYSITGNGAYLTLPKWGKTGMRPGRIQVETAKLLDAEDIPNLSVAEIQEVLELAILHDEDKVAREMMSGVKYKSKAPAEGLDGILYKCPDCGAEFQMETSATAGTSVTAGDVIRCKACGMEVCLDQSYVLHGGPFDSINTWYLWQQEQIDLDIPLESQTIVMAVGADGNRDMNAGSGVIRMDREAIHFEGTVFGQPLEFTETTHNVKAFPASVGSHFDIYHNKIMYNFRLQPDPRANIKWVAFLDKLNGNIRTE